MDINEKFVITINRQFGTGGHEIGEAIAKRLGVKLIDKQILQSVAEKFNMTEDELKSVEDRRPSWWEDFAMFYKSFMTMNDFREDKEITSRQLFYAQAAAMKQIAEQESCVIIGRCGFNVFKDYPNKLRLFIHSPREHHQQRIMERYHVDLEKARLLIEDNDYTREVFTKTFTGKDWYDTRNYDLTFDVTNFGVEGAVDFLMDFIRKS